MPCRRGLPVSSPTLAQKRLAVRKEAQAKQDIKRAQDPGSASNVEPRDAESKRQWNLDSKVEAARKRHFGVLSRNDLGRQVGNPPVTIRKVMGDFIDQGGRFDTEAVKSFLTIFQPSVDRCILSTDGLEDFIWKLY